MGGLDLTPALLFISSHLRCWYVRRLALPARSFWQQEAKFNISCTDIWYASDHANANL